jgi:hypothetical protein
MGEGRHFFEIKILRAKLGMGVYIGVAESKYNPQLRGLGMTTQMVPAKGIYEDSKAWVYYPHSGDFYHHKKVLGHSGVTCRRGDTVGVLYDGTKGTVEFFKNGEKLPGGMSGVSVPDGRLSPVVDLSLNAAVEIMYMGCWSDGDCIQSRGRASIDELTARSSNWEMDMRKVDKAEREFQMAVQLVMHQRKHEEVARRQAALQEGGVGGAVQGAAGAGAAAGSATGEGRGGDCRDSLPRTETQDLDKPRRARVRTASQIALDGLDEQKRLEYEAALTETVRRQQEEYEREQRREGGGQEEEDDDAPLEDEDEDEDE